MGRTLTRVAGVAIVAAVLCWTAVVARQAPPGAEAPASDAATAAAAADAFLAALTPEQRAVAALPFADAKKTTWHNFPPQMMPRAGVPFGALAPAQRALATRVINSVLSPYGAGKVTRTMEADAYLGTNMGAGFPTGPAAYSLAIFGTPSATTPWAVQVNGHHLGLNVAIAGRDNTMAPSLTGAYPARYVRDGREQWVVAEETDRAFALITALSGESRRQAQLAMAMYDLVLGPGHDGEMIQAEGVRASTLPVAQQEQLLALVAAWTDIMTPAAAAAKRAEVRAALADTYFAFSGTGTRRGDNIYFRVQGPTIFIEYSTQVNPGGGGGRGGGRGRQAGAPPNPNANVAGLVARGPNGEDLRDPLHVHAVYRDFTNDYGRKFTR